MNNKKLLLIVFMLVITSSFTFGATLVHEYLFENQAEDTAGVSNGTIHGAILTTGINGTGYYFDGNDDYIDLNFDGSFFSDGRPTGFSVSMWVRPTTNSTRGLLGNLDFFNYGFGMYSNQGTERYSSLMTRAGGSTYIYSPTESVWNQWNHIVFMFDNTGATDYSYWAVNGNISNGVATGNWFDSNGDTLLGRAYVLSQSDSYFEGDIDLVRIYQGKLTNEEIQAEYGLYCDKNWVCGNWSLCQETQIKECNLAVDTNNCGVNYTGDYSEFGNPSCCYEGWFPQYATCLVNNTQIKYYVDLELCGTTEYLPYDNDTYVACDYCQPDLEFIENQCIWNGTSYFTTTYWDDNNYYSCCAVTSETEDCVYDSSPYNETEVSLCVDKIEQFELQIDENVYLKPYERDDKVYATIWLNDTTQVFTCQSYVKTLDGYGVKDKRVIQINPIYEAKEKSFLTLDTRNYEDREFFTTNKGQATVYYTKENIVVDGRPYLFGVECVGNESGERLISEQVAYISYSIINEPVTLMFWINENTWAIVFTFIGLIFIVIIIGIGLKQLGIIKS